MIVLTFKDIAVNHDFYVVFNSFFLDNPELYSEQRMVTSEAEFIMRTESATTMVVLFTYFWGAGGKAT